MGFPKNLGWKLGSLLTAVLLWLAFSSAPLVVTTHTAPIVYSNLANSWMVAGNAPETVHLELRGPAGRLTVSSLAETVVRFDLANAGTTEDRTFTISESNLNLPPGYQLTGQSVSPERLSIAGAEIPVTSVTQVQTDAINLHGLTQSGDYRVDAFVDDPQVHFESPPQVTVHLTIEATGK